MLQTVVSEGSEAIALAKAVAWHAPRPWADRLHRASAAQEPGCDDDPQGGPLSAREQEVLRLLPTRLSTREIADELFISTNTLKFHLRMIYRKLGVTSRAEASGAARPRAHAGLSDPRANVS